MDRKQPLARTFLTTEELAERYRTSASSIRYRRMMGSGPAGVKYGRRVLYPLDVVEAYEAAQDQAQGVGGAA